ncbi:Wiskott-Aldrich syndrome protein 1 [Neopestalotiopsis sp. 37M]|nr:Wiskott-Aldrich syndrome protein 1 [Neopestalotiopsis sp. 37M]
MPLLRDITSETGMASLSRAQVTTSPMITTPATAPAPHFNTDDFIMGPDTCGFTSGTTITCTNPSDYCQNIGNYRGCCEGAIDQCSATVYTTCQEGLDNAYQAHVLYCTGGSPACMTHYFTTDDSPGSTYTNVACGTSDVFGQLYPYPPELMPTTSAAAHPRNTTTPSSSGNDASDKSSVSTGAIVGAIVGAIILVILLIISTVLIARRKKLQAHLNTSAAAAAMGGGGNRKGSLMSDKNNNPDALPAMPMSSSGGSSDAAEAERRRRLRLSTIPEALSPTSPTAAASSRRASAILGSRFNRKSARRSYGPDWPLGSADPLESHPMPPPPPPPPSTQQTPDPEKRMGDDEQSQTTAARGPPSSPPPLQGQAPRSIPTLNLPTTQSPPGGAASVPQLEVEPVSPVDDDTQSVHISPITPDSTRVMLTSPRLSYHPVSPMDAAFNDEVERRVSRLEGAGPAADRSEEPVSPIDDDDDYNGGAHPLDNRLSLISVPTRREGAVNLDEIVSPVSPDDEEDKTAAAAVTAKKQNVNNDEREEEEAQDAGEVDRLVR